MHPSGRHINPDTAAAGVKRNPPAAPQDGLASKEPVRAIPIGLDLFHDWSRPQELRYQHGFSTRSGNDGK
jgi:hypothetical protein